MKFQKIIFLFALIAFVVTGCKKEESKELALNITGMTCEIGCAKVIESKLSKFDGVLDAKVVFEENKATVKYDASKTNKASLISLVEGIAGGEMYKATETTGAKKGCASGCKKECCAGKESKAACTSGDKKDCCAGKEGKACTSGDKKQACTGKEGKACASGDKTQACAEADCKKECCSKA